MYYLNHMKFGAKSSTIWILILTVVIGFTNLLITNNYNYRMLGDNVWVFLHHYSRFNDMAGLTYDYSLYAVCARNPLYALIFHPSTQTHMSIRLEHIKK